jgi:nicotinate-nucleotide--dimethylbenzimidazole phosphoribosyltransferase
VDGFIAAAGALIALRLSPLAADYLILSHRSAETGASAMLDALGGEPLLDLRMRLGEGTGACLALGLIEAAVRCYTEMATFDSAGVSRET